MGASGVTGPVLVMSVSGFLGATLAMGATFAMGAALP